MANDKDDKLSKIDADIPVEEMIADLELKRLLDEALNRPLGMDQITILDTLAKIKRELRKHKSPAIDAEFKRKEEAKKKIPAAKLAKALEFKRQEKAANGSEDEE